VVTDGLNSYPKAIREELGEEINHERVKCTENPIEQENERTVSYFSKGLTAMSLIKQAL
jgi:transposase-like protein